MSAEVVDALFRVSRIAATHGATHALCTAALRDLAHAVDRGRPPFALQFVLSGAFRDRTLVVLDDAQLERAARVGELLARANMHEIAFDGVPEEPALIALAAGFAALAAGSADAFDTMEGSIAVREIVSARWGAEIDQVDPEVFSASQVALALREAEIVAQPSPTWNVPLGISVVRRVERILDRRARVPALRILETAQTPWTVARRALSATVWSALMLRDLGASPAVWKALVHTTLGVAVCGLDERGGIDLPLAARAWRERVAMTPALARGVDPHRTRLLVLSNALSRDPGARGPWMPISMVYTLERRRPSRGGAVAGSADLLAWAFTTGAGSVDARWGRLLANSVGIVPPGARVRMTDGRIGVVIGPGADRLRPRVLCGNAVVEPDEPVELVAGYT